MTIRSEVLGKKHKEYAASLDNLAGRNMTTGADDKAEHLYLESVAIRSEALGKTVRDNRCIRQSRSALPGKHGYSIRGAWQEAH